MRPRQQRCITRRRRANLVAVDVDIAHVRCARQRLGPAVNAGRSFCAATAEVCSKSPVDLCVSSKALAYLDRYLYPGVIQESDIIGEAIYR